MYNFKKRGQKTKMKTKYPYLDTEKRINMLRQENNITLETLAQKLDFSKVQTSNIMNGKQRYSLETAKKIADIFQVDYRYIIYEWTVPTWEKYCDIFRKEYEMQEKSLFYLLECHGYKIGRLVCYEYENDYIELDKLTNEQDGIANNIYEIITPKGKKMYFNDGMLLDLIDNFFILFDYKLIEKDIAKTWGIKL